MTKTITLIEATADLMGTLDAARAEVRTLTTERDTARELLAEARREIELLRAEADRLARAERWADA